MKARQFVAAEPLHTEPATPWATPEDREAALVDALRGVELGAHDERIVDWMLRLFDVGTLRTVVSLFERVRDAGMVQVLDTENALRDRRPR